MISHLDLYRAAAILVKRYGEEAPVEAAMRADAMLEEGYLEGHGVWKGILKAVEELNPAT